MATLGASSSSFGFEGLLFRQLFEAVSSTYTYILADASDKTLPGLIIDPVDVTAERDASLLKELGVTPLYALNTHVHADHITGTAKLKGTFPDLTTVISEASLARADKHVRHGDFIIFGSFSLQVRATPGHTAGCVTYVLRRAAPIGDGEGSPTKAQADSLVQPVNGSVGEAGPTTGAGPELMAFTGDALLIRGCGRTDFQEGDARQLYQSVHSEIFSLRPQTLLFPAHDYKGRTVTTVEEELKFNLRLTKSKDEFKTIMDNLGLPYPKQFDRAVPANMVCGFHEA